MTSLARFIAGALVVSLEMGCVPIPHIHKTASATGGIVLRDDEPAQGIRVRRVLGGGSGAEACTSVGEDVTTGDDGTFRFPEAQRVELFVALYGDPVAPVTVCIDAGDGLIPAWHSLYLGRKPPASLAMVCKVSTTTAPARRRGEPTPATGIASCEPVR
jgi:hypothetical protein